MSPVATRAFRRYSTYRAATLAGIFTNSVFRVIYSWAHLALWHQHPGAGGYDATDAVTYVWLGQALLMTVALWGGGSTDELTDRIRSGDVALDLSALMVAGLLFDLRWPGSPAAGLGVLVEAGTSTGRCRAPSSRSR